MVTTEIATFPMKAGLNPGNPEDLSSQVLEDTFTTLRTRDGMQQIQFGTHVEDPSTLQLAINWDSIDKHKEFIVDSSYGPFFEKFGKIAGGQGSMVHVDFKPPGAVTKVFSAPVTEMATFYFEGEPPADYIDGVHKLNQTVTKEEIAGYLGIAVGKTHEEVEKDGVKGHAMVAAIGWQSVDAHMEFRNTRTFKDIIPLLRSTSKGVEMHHVQFMQSQ